MILPQGTYGYAELELGHRVETQVRKITAEMIDDFAHVSGDNYAIHMEDKAAQARGFPARIAHGLLILSVIDGLKNTAPARLDALASLGWNWRFADPVFIGDTIRAVFCVAEKRLTSTNNRGLVTSNVEVFNQHGACVQSGQNTLIFDLA